MLGLSKPNSIQSSSFLSVLVQACELNYVYIGYPVINATAIDTTDLAAMAAWHILQGFYSGLPQLDSKVTSKAFNLWTESYGGHYGPSVGSPRWRMKVECSTDIALVLQLFLRPEPGDRQRNYAGNTADNGFPGDHQRSAYSTISF